MASQRQSPGTLRYAGLATQWLVMLGVAVFAGIKLDAWLNWKFPVCTIVFPSAALILSLWQLIKEFSKPKK